MDQSWISRAIGTREVYNFMETATHCRMTIAARINQEGKFKVPRIQWKWHDIANLWDRIKAIPKGNVHSIMCLHQNYEISINNSMIHLKSLGKQEYTVQNYR